MISVSDARELYAVLKQLDISVLSFQKEIIHDDDGTYRVIDKPKTVGQIIDELIDCFYLNSSTDAFDCWLDSKSYTKDWLTPPARAMLAIGALKFMYNGGAEFTKQQRDTLDSILTNSCYFRFTKDLFSNKTKMGLDDDEPEKEFDAFINSFPTIGGDLQ